MISDPAQLAQFNEPDMQFNEPDMMFEFTDPVATPIIAEPVATPDLGAGPLLGAIIILALTIFLIVLLHAGLWKIFKKAGVQGWKAIVPFYNLWTMFKVAGKPGWWALFPWAWVVLLVPMVIFPALHSAPLAFFLFVVAAISAFISVVLWDIMGIDLSRAFGKSTAFSVLCWVYFPILGPILLGFGKAQYIGLADQTQAVPQTPPQPPQTPTQTLFPPQSPPRAPILPPQQDPPQQTPPPPQTPISW